MNWPDQVWFSGDTGESWHCKTKNYLAKDPSLGEEFHTAESFASPTGDLKITWNYILCHVKNVLLYIYIYI